jgi:CheY-like chemotaxis protein
MKRFLCATADVELISLVDRLVQEPEAVFVDFADDGLEAFLFASRIRYNALIVDYDMNYLDATNFIKALRYKPNYNQNARVFVNGDSHRQLPEFLRDDEGVEFVA